MNTKGYLRKNVTSGVKVINSLAYEYFVVYGFVLVPDCTIHFVNVLKYRASENKYRHINCQIDLH